MNIFMTGATGVIGRRALPLLVQSGHSVSAAVRSSANALEVESEGAKAVPVDLFDRAVRRGRAPLPGDDDAYFSSISHDDAAAAVLAALRLPSGVYNVSDDEPLRRRDYTAALARALHVPLPRPLPRWLTSLAGSLGELMSRSVRISNRKLRRAGDWRPIQASAREGWPAIVAAMASGDAAARDDPGSAGERPIAHWSGS